MEKVKVKERIKIQPFLNWKQIEYLEAKFGNDYRTRETLNTSLGTPDSIVNVVIGKTKYCR